MSFREPIYIQIYNLIKQKIEDHEYLVGEAIPSERELSREYGVSRMTVKKSIDLLVEEGLVIRKQGSGTYVSENFNPAISLGNFDDNAGMSAQLKIRGLTPSSDILDSRVILATHHLSKKLEVEEGEPIFFMNRLRLGDEEPIAIEYTFIPQATFKDILDYDFSEVSLYSYMDVKGHVPVNFDQNMSVVKVSRKDADYLNLDYDEFVFKFEYYGYDKEKNKVEYTSSYVRPDIAEITFTRRND